MASVVTYTLECLRCHVVNMWTRSWERWAMTKPREGPGPCTCGSKMWNVTKMKEG